MKDESPLVVAGLWDEWVDTDTGEILRTASIVTTVGNPTMARIHNNPKAEGPRMPVILPRDKQDEWLLPYEGESDKKRLADLMKPFDESLLTYHTVGRLKGKEALGNVKEAEKEFIYEELNSNF